MSLRSEFETFKVEALNKFKTIQQLISKDYEIIGNYHE